MVRSMGHSVHAKEGKKLIIVNLSMFVYRFVSPFFSIVCHRQQHEYIITVTPSFDMTPEFKPFIKPEYRI